MTERLLAASTTTLDRLLIAVRSLVASRHNLRRGRQLTVRTFTGWNRPPAGFLEIDPVARCGESIGGSSLYSLVATGVCNSWTEAVPLLASEQPLLVSGLEAIAKQLPLPVPGMDSDNDSVFINDTFTQYCAGRGV